MRLSCDVPIWFWWNAWASLLAVFAQCFGEGQTPDRQFGRFLLFDGGRNFFLAVFDLFFDYFLQRFVILVGVLFGFPF